ncbi:MAG: hypothetical protein K6L60_05670 [Oceanobacter sp.]
MSALHIDFTDFGKIVRDVRLELPGVLDASILDMCALVMADFCEETQAYRESITLNAGVAAFDLVPPHSDAIVIGIASIELDGQLVEPGGYRQSSPDLIEFADVLKSDATAIVVLKPEDDTDRAPKSILERWRQVIGLGVKSRFMLQPSLSWSNPSLGLQYRREYLHRVSAAAADVRNEFSVTRRGSSPHKINVYY